MVFFGTGSASTKKGKKDRKKHSKKKKKKTKKGHGPYVLCASRRLCYDFLSKSWMFGCFSTVDCLLFCSHTSGSKGKGKHKKKAKKKKDTTNRGRGPSCVR